jgi:hypothetical protein
MFKGDMNGILKKKDFRDKTSFEMKAALDEISI